MEDLLRNRPPDKFRDAAPSARAEYKQIDFLIPDEIAEGRNLAVEVPEAMCHAVQLVGSMKTAHQILAVPVSQFVQSHHQVRHQGELGRANGVKDVECGPIPAGYQQGVLHGEVRPRREVSRNSYVANREAIMRAAPILLSLYDVFYHWMLVHQV
jgi:hypothetical protein